MKYILLGILLIPVFIFILIIGGTVLKDYKRQAVKKNKKGKKGR
jgi:hypothetical protein